MTVKTPLLRFAYVDVPVGAIVQPWRAGADHPEPTRLRAVGLGPDEPGIWLLESRGLQSDGTGAHAQHFPSDTVLYVPVYIFLPGEAQTDTNYAGFYEDGRRWRKHVFDDTTVYRRPDGTYVHKGSVEQIPDGVWLVPVSKLSRGKEPPA